MREISDAFLLNIAEVSSALVGLFLVGMLFFVETGFRKFSGRDGTVERYFRSSARIVMILYSIPIILSLTLVALEPVWSTILFALLIVLLVAANVDTLRRIRSVVRATGSTALAVNEALGSVGVLAIVLIPWILGGLEPTRSDLTWSILLAFVIGFLSVCATVLTAFDITRDNDHNGPREDAGKDPATSAGRADDAEPGGEIRRPARRAEFQIPRLTILTAIPCSDRLRSVGSILSIHPSSRSRGPLAGENTSRFLPPAVASPICTASAGPRPAP